MTEAERRMLRELAEARGLSASDVIRLQLREAHEAHARRQAPTVAESP
jgi:hypothetical protein